MGVTKERLCIAFTAHVDFLEETLGSSVSEYRSRIIFNYLFVTNFKI